MSSVWFSIRHWRVGTGTCKWWHLPVLEVNMATTALYILVRLWIHRGLETEFEAYERKVSRIMARYGGVIERASGR
jgi:hypothetical protein